MLSLKPRVLVVDEMSGTSHPFEELLGDDFNIAYTRTKADASDSLENNPTDLVFVNACTATDEFSSQLRACIANRPIALALFASEHGDSATLQQGNADVFLAPPYDSATLRARLMALVESRQHMSLLPLGKAIFHHSREAIMVTDTDERIIDVNPAFTELTGYSGGEIIGKTPAFLKSGRHDQEFYRQIKTALETTGSWSGEIWNRMKNGELHPQYLTACRIQGADGAPTYYLSIWTDIRMVKNHPRKLERLANYDPLTDQPNASLLEDRIHQAIAYTLRAGGLLGIGFLDIDGYRTITDRLGHEAGDKVLLEVAKRMTDLLRAGDTVARVGGDEFVYLMVGVENAEECESITDRLIKLLAEPIALPQGEVSITASVGLTFAPVDCINPQTLIHHADEAMVAAKTAGKNGYRVYQPSDESVGC